MSKLQAEIGIFGGSGLYEFFKKGKWVDVETPYGRPSDKVFLTEYNGKKIAFLPRHGRKHQFPPHKINYRANLFAFKKLGVKRIIAPAAAGSLQPNIKPGDFVVCDQFVDRTNSREDTFYPGPTAKEIIDSNLLSVSAESLESQKGHTHPVGVVHISSADPYCPELRKIAIKACQKNRVRVHKKGTVVVIQGPRFSTRSESKWFTKMGWEVISMTQYPEMILARELEICYVNISLITDYDAGLEGHKGIKPVTTEEVMKVFGRNTENVKKVILSMIKMMPEKPSCQCQEALKGAEI